MLPDGRARTALLTWIGLYPVLTALALLLEPALAGSPTPVRTLIMSAIMVPVMVYAVMPGMNQLAAALTRAARSRRARCGP